jgi:hypothetical protein
VILAQQAPQPPLPPGSEITLTGRLNDLAAMVLLLGASPTGSSDRRAEA